MITEEEKKIIDAFTAINRSNSVDEKLQLYKSINKILGDLENFSSDNLNVRTYMDQFFYDLTNFYSSPIFLEICKCFRLMLLKVMRNRVVLRNYKVNIWSPFEIRLF